MIEELERLTRSYFDVEEGEVNTHSHLDYVVEQLKSGRTIADMARSLSEIMQDTLARETLSSYLHSLPDGTERITNAKPTQALAMIEDAIVMVDEHPTDKLAVAHAVARARVRESHAKMINPEFQQSKQQGVTLNIGTLHLAALRAPDTAHAHVRIVSGDAEGSALE
jgi:hypothetical protein